MCLACNPGMSAVLQYAAASHRFHSYRATPSFPAGGSVSPTTVAPSRARADSPDGPADIIFRGGPILTMNDRGSRAEALAVRGDRILAVGRIEDVDAWRGPGTRIVDLDGRTLLPGLIDAHMHSSFAAFLEDWLDVSPITTPTYDGVLAKLRDAVGRTGQGEWVLAQQFDPSITVGARTPSLADLDAIAPNNPFMMIESNGHIAYVNSVALRIAGVSRDTPDPPMARFGRDADGNLTGRLEESGAFQPFIARIPQATATEMQARIRRLIDHAATVGCTTLHDCGIGSIELALLDAVMADSPPVRYRGMLVSTEMDTWEKMGLRPGRGDDRFRISGIKAWADGSNQARTGFQRENYLNSDTRGALNYTLEQLTDAIRRGHNGGWQVGVHANGDAGIDTTIEAYESVLREHPRADHRHRIEHCSVLHPEQIVKMRDLGLSPSFLIGHVRWWGKAFLERILGPERTRFYDPCASALAAGLRISLHSDCSVTPIEPLRYVEDAVTRIMVEGGDVLFAEERIPVEAALRAVTIDAAWQCRMDDKVGSLEPGKLADLALLEQDPTASDPAEIRTIKVSETWLSGEQQYIA